MAAGVTDRLRDMSDVVALLDGEREQGVQAGRQKQKAKIEQSVRPRSRAIKHELTTLNNLLLQR